MSAKPSILVIDDEPASCRTLKLHFGGRGFDVEVATSADEGLAKLHASPTDIVVSDIRMPGRDGLSLLSEVKECYPTVPVIMITAFQDLDSTIAAMHGGAFDYVLKPIDLDELEDSVDRALELRKAPESGGMDLDMSGKVGSMVGRGRAMKDVFTTIGMVSQSRVTVLILGESGTGKSIVADAIHDASAEAELPFIAVNCAALVETLLESELFGHERGAFTGAYNTRKGKVEQAGGGTLFLDEIGQLSPRMQGKLLRLLEEREFSPVGSNRTLTSEARFVVATNANLADLVSKGEFREDLFYRMNVVNITLPPLRDRRKDIPYLVEHLLRKITRDVRKSIRRLPAEVMEVLMAHDWPGNIRELKNVLMRAVVMAQGDTITLDLLPEEISGVRPANGGGGKTGVVGETAAPVHMSLKDVERDHLQRVLDSTGWHRGRTCEILGISRPRLDRRIKEYGLSPKA
ncbi:MAG: sigma-54-dependent transcriptional regulator [Sphingomonadales bacterium]